MNQQAIFLPFFALMLLTLLVWVYMYYRRTSFLLAERIDLRLVDTPEKAAKVIPDNVALAAHNLRNLFELPVIFYALCVYLYVVSSVDQVYLLAAWAFFVCRVLHSVVQVTSNVVIYRFSTYFVSAGLLWFMVLRAALSLIATF
jgi:hypothetical protein